MSNKGNSVCEAKSVNHIAISVPNLARSRDWYRQTFGLRPIQESAESVLLGFGKSMIVLRVEGTPGTISHFMFGIDGYDADALRAELAAAGLEPQKDSDSFHVRDPDGLNVQVGDRGLGLASGIVENGFKMKCADSSRVVRERGVTKAPPAITRLCHSRCSFGPRASTSPSSTSSAICPSPGPAETRCDGTKC
jgi:catechol 2,3-dioxygenase-like lactoylglutathione lyase family enzyme